jgi:hypothetical protein
MLRPPNSWCLLMCYWLILLANKQALDGWLSVHLINTIGKQALNGWLGVHLINTIGKQALNGWLGVHGHGFLMFRLTTQEF